MRWFRIKNRWMKVGCALVLLLIIIVAWFNLYSHAQKSLWYDEASEERIAVLQTKMRFLEMQFQRKQDIIDSLQVKLKSSNLTESEGSEEKYIKIHLEEIMTHLKNLSGGFQFVKPEAKPEALETALTYTTMPHLLRHPRARCPAFQIRSSRKSSDIDVVIGVPTVKRDKEDYLHETIKSLIDGMKPEERERTLIVIFIGEAHDLEYVANTAYEINLLFEPYFGTLIEIISPTIFWYPNWDTLDPTLGDSQKRTQWRTKQNLDAIFIISYAQNKGTYYLMLEDDVQAKKGFMKKILKYAARKTISSPNWFYINFSTVGGIGKFFRMEDLGYFSAYVQIFYQHMPIDWMMDIFLANRICGIDKSSVIDMISNYDPDDLAFDLFSETEEKECTELKGVIRPTYKISLFEHIGFYSSLRGKLQKVKPSARKGKKIPLFYPHVNPPIKNIVSSIRNYKEHTIERAYSGEDFFWGVNPRANETVEFWFDPPIHIDKFFFRTGNFKHMKDVIKQGVVELLPEKLTGFLCVQEFDEFGNSEGTIDPKIGPLSAIRIRILEDIKHWIIINEIELM